MNGTIDPKPTDRIYLDTNAFIAAFEGRDTLAEVLRALLVTLPKHAPQRLLTSELTLSELLVKPLELGRNDLVQIYDSWMVTSAFLEVVPVTREVLREAAILRSRDKALRLPDAIHLTTAVAARCRYFLSGDLRIAGHHGVEVIRLTEHNIRRLLDAHVKEP